MIVKYYHVLKRKEAASERRLLREIEKMRLMQKV